jgi:type IV pilus assembly protein PilC
MIILVIIFAVVVPLFADAFSSMSKELPSSTKLMLAISAYMRSWRIVIPLVGLAIVGLIAYRVKKSAAGKRWWDTLLFHLPFIGHCKKIRAQAFIFQTLSLFLSGGVHLVAALGMIERASDNEIVKNQIAYIANEVRTGIPLGEAMLRCPHSLFQLDAIALIRVAHESGALATVLEQLGMRYQSALLRSLSRGLLFVQPVLMLMLGLLVMLLIIALYAPIMNMSQAL